MGICGRMRGSGRRWRCRERGRCTQTAACTDGVVLARDQPAAAGGGVLLCRETTGEGFQRTQGAAGSSPGELDFCRRWMHLPDGGAHHQRREYLAAAAGIGGGLADVAGGGGDLGVEPGPLYSGKSG